MLIPFFRTVILYACIILAIRLMGKRQVGEMQPAELVVTILVSAVASVPMQDLDIPLTHGLVPVFTLIAFEVFLSVLTLKWPALRQLTAGKAVPVVQEGVMDQQALKQLRVSAEDLLEDLRLEGVFDLREVTYAQVETNGKLSVLQKNAGCGPFFTLVADGRAVAGGLEQVGKDPAWRDSLLRARGARDLSQVFLFCADRQGNMIFLKKEGR